MFTSIQVVCECVLVCMWGVYNCMYSKIRVIVSIFTFYGCLNVNSYVLGPESPNESIKIFGFSDVIFLVELYSLYDHKF